MKERLAIGIYSVINVAVFLVAFVYAGRSMFPVMAFLLSICVTSLLFIRWAEKHFRSKNDNRPDMESK